MPKLGKKAVPWLMLAAATVAAGWGFGLGPRWPDPLAVSIATALLIAVTPAAVKALLPGASFRLARLSDRRRRLVKLAGIASLALFVAYFLLDSLLCHRIVGYRDRVVGGFVLKDEAKMLLDPPDDSEMLPTPLDELLSDADQNPFEIWTTSSVLISRALLLSTWYLAWVGLALSLATTTAEPATLMPGVQFEEHLKAINRAYDRASLERLLHDRLGRALEYGDDASFDDWVFEVLSAAEREGWHPDLIRAAHLDRPGNADIAKLYDKYGYGVEVAFQHAGAAVSSAPAAVSAPGFERRIRSQNPMVDMAVWREKLTEVEGRVCRIEANGRALGTGFLVGPDLVLTNYHVMEGALVGKTPSSDIACRFDYKVLADGSRQQGTEVRLDPDNWNVSSSPYSLSEKLNTPDAALPTLEELDYALIRLAEPIGNLPIAVAGDGNGPPRGWTRVKDPFPELHKDVALLIAQHPDGAPLKLAIDTQGVIGQNANGTRVRYTINTEPGSSGSPCFTLDWELAALHHYGDPAYNHPQWNQGIPIAAVWRRMRATCVESAIITS